MTSKQPMIPIAESDAKVSFEVRRASMYLKALNFDKIPPETLPEYVVFSSGNTFAEKWRKMLH